MQTYMENAYGKRTTDAFAWTLNISTSVAIVMANKQLMGTAGHGFVFATTLCGLHFACTSGIRFLDGKNENNRADGSAMMVPPREIFLFVVVAIASIVALNFSLMLNTIGFYQVCKLAQIPTMCLLEAIFLGRQFGRKTIQAILIVLVGVGVATVSDMEMNFAGTVAALIGVSCTSAQQIAVSYLQKKHSVSSNFLLAKTSPYMAAAMLGLGPFLDRIVVNEWVTEYEWTEGAVVFLAASCALAVLVNISSFMCIGRFSAVSFQVIGHVKTVLVFFFGFVCFSAPITHRNILGCSLAVMGMIYYSRVQLAEKAQAASRGGPLGEKA
jgi:solute carrier family 35, member E3